MARRQPRYHKPAGKALGVLPIIYGHRNGALITFQLKARLALDSFRTGNATLDDLAAINAVLATGLLLATDETTEVAGFIEQARLVLLQAGHVMQQMPNIFPTDEEFIQLANGLSCGEALLEASTRRHVLAALSEALRSSKGKAIEPA
jgi:hypothetical protein